MTIHQLEYFIAVHQNKSFSKAAKKCFVTQPSLSMQIQKLEEELDVVLFDRQKKPVITTEIGELIASEALELIAQAKRIKNLVKQEQGEISGQLHLGVIPTIAPYLVPLFVSDFLENYPNINLRIEELTTQTIIDKLKNDTLDIGILATPLEINGITEVKLYTEALYFYVSQLHPFYTLESIEAKDIRPDEFLLMSEGHCFRNQVINLCGQLQNNTNRFSFESSSIETLIRMVDKRAALTIIPESAVLHLNPAQKLSVKSIKGNTLGREVSLVMKRTKFKQKLIQALQDSIITHLPKVLQNTSFEALSIGNSF